MTNTKKLSKIKDLKVIDLEIKNGYDLDHCFLYESLSENLKQLLEKNKIGFNDSTLKLYYSLSHCQGDGLCFIGDFVFNGLNIYVTHNSNYYYSSSVGIEVEEEEDNDELSELLKEKIFNNFKEIFENICNELEKNGYQIIEQEEEDEILRHGFNDWKEENNINCDYEIYDCNYLTKEQKGFIKICSSGDTYLNGLWIEDTDLKIKTKVKVTETREFI